MEKKRITNDYLFSIKELASVMNVGELTVRKLIKNGTLHSVRIGKLHRVPAIEYRRYIGSTASVQ